MRNFFTGVFLTLLIIGIAIFLAIKQGYVDFRADQEPSVLERKFAMQAVDFREINRLKDRLTFVETDAFKLIEEHKADKDAAFYIDPPYTLAARRLYTAW